MTNIQYIFRFFFNCNLLFSYPFAWRQMGMHRNRMLKLNYIIRDSFCFWFLFLCRIYNFFLRHKVSLLSHLLLFFLFFENLMCQDMIYIFVRIIIILLHISIIMVILLLFLCFALDGTTYKCKINLKFSY